MFLRNFEYPEKIRILFFPVFLIMAAGFLLLYEISVKSLVTEHKERLDRTSRLTENGLRLTEKEMKKLVNLFQTNRNLAEYLYVTTVLGGDRTPLKDLLEPIYSSLDIDTLSMYDLSRVNIMHLDKKAGDSRNSDKLAGIADLLSENANYGFYEAGGSVMVVATAPIKESGKILGYISIGKYLDGGYIRSLAEMSGNGILLVKARRILDSTIGGIGTPYFQEHGRTRVTGLAYSVIEHPISGIRGNPLGLLVIALSERDLTESVYKLKLSMCIIAALSAAAFFVLSRLFVRALSDPLKEIIPFIGKIAKGQFDGELVIAGKDELSALATHVNDMKNQLKSNRSIMEQYTDRLEDAVRQRTSELEKVQSQLLQAQKMEVIGRLAGGIAHDFNNILTSIIGYGELLQDNLGQEGELRNYADMIHTSAERASYLTQNLLAFSRKQIISPKPTDLNEIAAKTRKLFSRMMGEDIELNFIFYESELIVLADPGQLEQVFMNLFTNARDSMASGGVLTLKTGLTDRDCVNPDNAPGIPRTYVFFSVSDTGTGMDENTKSNIFEPFFTTKRPGQGTGLGLSIVYDIVKQHGGWIEATSEPGAGATFSVFLPRFEGNIEITDGEKRIPVTGGFETILFAEDDEMLRDFAGRQLRKAGYKVITAEDGDSAVRKYDQYASEISLLLLDVIMPKKNGKEVYSHIKALSPEIKTLFLSGYSAEFISMRGRLDNGLNFIHKPFSSYDLLKRVRQVLDS